MRIAILAKGGGFHAVRRLSEAARKRGFEAIAVNPSDCALTSPGDIHSIARPLSVLWKGRPFPAVDALIPRIVPSIAAQGIAVLRALSLQGVCSLVSAETVASSLDPMRCWMTLSAAGCPLPASIAVNSAAQGKMLVQARRMRFPVRVTPIGGASGESAPPLFCESRETLFAALDAALGVFRSALIQSACPADGRLSQSRLLRVYVIAGRAVAALEVLSALQEVRLRKRALSEPVKAAAETAARAVGAEAFSSADILEDAASSSACVLSLNCTPGLREAEAALRMDLAGLVIEAARGRALAFRGQNSRRAG